MEGGREALAGGFRLQRVRKVKLYLYIVQLLFVIGIVIFVLAAEGRFSLKPFYLPINSFIYFVLLMALIFSAEGFVFKTLEMRFSRSHSTKYYMAKIAVRRSLVIVLVAAVVLLIFWTPPVTKGIEDVLSKSGTVTGVASFYNEDPLGLTTTDRVTLTAVDGTARVYVVSEKHYRVYSHDMDMLSYFRINGQDDLADPTISFDFPRSDYSLYYIVIDHRYSNATAVTYTLHQNLSSTFIEFVPLFALLFIITNLGWIFYLIPMKRRYAAGAIYR